jgi:hypothetical protein
MCMELDESSASFDNQELCTEKINMPQQLRRMASSDITSDNDSDFMSPASPGLQRWISESNTCFDDSPGLVRRWEDSEEGHCRNHPVMDKQQRKLLIAPPGPFLDDQYCEALPPPLLLQRWASESEESLDEKCPPPRLSSGLGRWASESCGGGAAYKKSAPPLPPARGRVGSEQESDEPIRLE